MAQDMKRGVSDAGSELISWCYRSLAEPGLTLSDILRITEQAQQNNGRLGVTGVLFYADGHFLQWLEGPAPAVEGIMAHILRDGRHREVESLSKETLTSRRFGDWHMQLSCSEADAAQLSQGQRGQVIVVDDAVARPKDAPLRNEGIFAVRRFLSDVSNSNSVPHAELRPAPQGNVTTFALRAVPPRVAHRVVLADKAAELITLLLGPNPLGQLEAIEALFRDYGPSPADFARLYEAYTEALAESLREDGASIMQVGLAGTALQLVLRRIHHVPDPQRSHGAVTVAAVPGETRFLEATISGEMLRAAGWSTLVVYPQTDDELVDRLKQTETRTLVLAASALDPMHHDAHLLRLIARLKADPDLPRLRIVLGGRLAQQPSADLVAMGVAGWFDHLLDVTAAVVRVACPDGADCGSMRACRQPGAACCNKRINSSFLLANVIPSVAERMVSRRRQSA